MLFSTTKRPFKVRIFRSLGYLLLLVLSPTIFLVGDVLSRIIFTDTESIKFLSVSLFILAATLSLPFSYLLLIHKMKKRFITITHFTLQVVLIGGVCLINNLVMNFSEKEIFYHHSGNCSSLFGSLLQTQVGKNIYQTMSHQLPLSTQYALLSIEDTCRVNLLKDEFVSKEHQYCENGISNVECLSRTYDEISKKAPFTTGGTILAVGFRRLFILNESKKVRAETSFVNDKLNGLSEVIKLSLWAINNVENFDTPNYLAKKETVKQFTEMPIEEKNYYDIVVRNNFFGMNKSPISLVMGKSLQNLPDDVDRSLAEYYLLRIIDQEVKSDFLAVAKIKAENLIKEGKTKLENLKDEKTISKEDYKKFAEAFDQYEKVLEGQGQ